jgi:hypothetical protein
VIEVSDTEVPRDLFLRFVPSHKFPKEACPEPDCPILRVRFVIAAAFCNALTDSDGLGIAQRCYGEPSLRSIRTVPRSLDLAGYRLLTDREFLRACRAGTTAKRYYGDSSSLLRNYAWYDDGRRLQSHPVARLKPNELGLFDTLGNAHELCETSGAPQHPEIRAMFCGASAKHNAIYVTCTQKLGPTSIDQRQGVDDVGFRVARTVRPRPQSE